MFHEPTETEGGVPPPPPNTRCDTVPSSSSNEDIPHPRTRPSPPRSPPSPELVTHSTSQEKDPDECFMNPQRPRGGVPPPPPPPHGLTPSRDHHASRTYPTRGPDPVHLAALRRPIWIPTVSARRSPLGLQISIGPPTNTRPQRSFCSHTPSPTVGPLPTHTFKPDHNTPYPYPTPLLGLPAPLATLFRQRWSICRL